MRVRGALHARLPQHITATLPRSYAAADDTLHGHHASVYGCHPRPCALRIIRILICSGVALALLSAARAILPVEDPRDGLDDVGRLCEAWLPGTIDHVGHRAGEHEGPMGPGLVGMRVT